MSARCSAITSSGARCRQTITGPDGLCAAHSSRVKAAPAPGASRGTPALEAEAATYRRRLVQIAEASYLADPEMNVKGHAVAIQGYQAALRAIQVEAHLRDARELENRIRRIEEAQRWGA